MDCLLRNINTGLKRVKLTNPFFESQAEFDDQNLWAKIGYSQFLNVQIEAGTLTSESPFQLNLFNDIIFRLCNITKNCFLICKLHLTLNHMLYLIRSPFSKGRLVKGLLSFFTKMYTTFLCNLPCMLYKIFLSKVSNLRVNDSNSTSYQNISFGFIDSF